MNVIDQITAEVARATVKFPTWPTDPLHALAVLGEEFGELTKAMLQHTYEPHKGVTQQDIREEAIQTAAMAMRLAMSLDSYEYRRGEQHKQSSEGDRFIGRDVREIARLEEEVAAIKIELRDTLAHPDDGDTSEYVCCHSQFELKGWNGEGYEVGHWHAAGLWLKNAIFPVESEAAQYVRIMNIVRWPVKTPNASSPKGDGRAAG